MAGRLRFRTRDVSGGGGVPAPPSANMVLRVLKGTGITSAAGAVSAWADQSGLAHHLVQATGANQPTLEADGTVTGDGVADFLKAVGFTLNQPETVYLRCMTVSAVANARYLDGNAADTLGVLSGATAILTLRAGAASDAGIETVATVGVWKSFAFVFNGAASSRRAEGQAPTTVDAGANNASGFTLFARGSNTSPANIRVSEVIVYNVAHDAATQATIMAGMTARHP